MPGASPGAVPTDDHWRLRDTGKGIGPGVLTAPLPALGPVAILERTSGFVRPPRTTRVALGVAAIIVVAAAILVAVCRRRLARRA